MSGLIIWASFGERESQLLELDINATLRDVFVELGIRENIHKFISFSSNNDILLNPDESLADMGICSQSHIHLEFNKNAFIKDILYNNNNECEWDYFKDKEPLTQVLYEPGDANGEYILSYVIGEHGRHDVLCILLENNILPLNSSKLLHCATFGKGSEISVRYLLEKGIDVLEKDCGGKTIFDYGRSILQKYQKIVNEFYPEYQFISDPC